VTGAIETEIAFSTATQESLDGLLAVLYAQESFEYAAGSLEGQNGGTGWATAWTLTFGSSAIVNATGLSDPSTLLPVSGGTAEMSTSSIFTQNRDLTTTLGTDGTTAWFSFLVKPDGVSFGGISLEIGDGTTNDKVTVGTNDNDFLITKNASTFGAARIDNVLVDAQTYFLAVQIDFAAGVDTVTRYVDPTPGLSNPDSVLTTQLATADFGTFTQVGMIGGFSGNNSNIDEIRVGDEFTDVAPNGVSNQPPTLDLDANNSSGATGSDFNANFNDGGGSIAVVDVDAIADRHGHGPSERSQRNPDRRHFGNEYWVQFFGRSADPVGF
jgi:hypothetical protein